MLGLDCPRHILSHHYSYLPTHSPMNIYRQRFKTPKQRFWEKVDIRGEDECWEWRGSIVSGKSGGYGCFSLHGKNRKAHQVSWILTFGDIPELPNSDVRGTCVLHSCDNRKCVNPKHLFLGTNDDNMKDMVKKGRAKNVPKFGKDNWNTKLTEDQVKEIRNLSLTGLYRYKDIGELFGVSASAIGLIVRREHWTWVK